MKPDLSNELYTKVVPSLSSFEVSSRYVDAKTVECERLRIDGKTLENIINEEKLQPLDLAGREIIGEDDYYVLWDDNGQPIDVKLPEGYCPSFANCKGLKEWRWDLSKYKTLDSTFMNCKNLSKFNSDLSNLENGAHLFDLCSKLSEVNSEFINLKDGTSMFANSGITTISGNFPKLQKAAGMFYGNWRPKEFEGNLQNLTEANGMFCWCNNLRSFKANLDLLKDGDNMFAYCGLKSFDAELISLVRGGGMFVACSLDKTSVQKIINCLRTTNVLTTTASLSLGIDKTLATDSELLEFLQISEGVNQSITITPPVRTLEDGTVVGGGTWTVNLTWN